MIIIVTGCAGFIGSRVADMLLEQGHTVFGIDNMLANYDIRLKEYRINELLKRTGFTFYRSSICDKEALETVFEGGADACIHLAARAGVRASVSDPQSFVDANITGTLSVLEACRRHGVGKLVLSSTSSMYGGLNPPFREDAHTDKPLSPYAASKGAAEMLAHTYHVLHGLDVTICRYFTVYGPAGRPDMSVLRFVQAIEADRPITVYGDGTQERDFTYVDDIARGTIAALSKVNGCEIVNLGSDRPVRLVYLINLLESLLSKKARIIYKPAHPADPKITWADVHKAQRLFGWSSEVTLEEGLARTVDWYLKEYHWAHLIDTTGE